MNSTKKTIILILFLLSIGSLFYINTPESNNATQKTKNAYIQADITNIAPQISGVIDKVFVEDNQRVQKGELLATIISDEYRIEVSAAHAKVANAKAKIESLQAKIVLQDSIIKQASARVSANETKLLLANKNYIRYRNLATDGSGTKLASQQAETTMKTQIAELEKSNANFIAQKQQVAVLLANLKAAKSQLNQAQAAVEKAKLQLSYTKILAPINGVIGHKSIRVGSYATAGKTFISIVPIQNIYILANFRETQLANIQKNQPVSFTVDAIPGVELKGHVDSIEPASVVSYGAVPPRNATGNFTKIVQRLPVKICIDKGQKITQKLHVGMSVTPSIHTDY